jgi:hypothetical protein
MNNPPDVWCGKHKADYDDLPKLPTASTNWDYVTPSMMVVVFFLWFVPMMLIASFIYKCRTVWGQFIETLEETERRH